MKPSWLVAIIIAVYSLAAQPAAAITFNESSDGSLDLSGPLALETGINTISGSLYGFIAGAEDPYKPPPPENDPTDSVSLYLPATLKIASASLAFGPSRGYGIIIDPFALIKIGGASEFVRVTTLSPVSVLAAALPLQGAGFMEFFLGTSFDNDFCLCDSYNSFDYSLSLTVAPIPVPSGLLLILTALGSLSFFAFLSQRYPRQGR